MRTLRTPILAIIVILTASLITLAPAVSRAQVAPVVTELVLPSVRVGQAGTADLHLTELRNPRLPSGMTILAVHGFGHNGTAFRALAERIFAGPSSAAVSRVLLLDLPGHGSSGLPSVLPYFQLTMEDYADAVDGALGALAATGRRVDLIAAHSMGGGVVQILQDRLIAAGSSLRAAHGARAVVLLAPSMPRALPFAFGEADGVAAFLASLVVLDPVRGPTLVIPPPVFLGLFFTDTGGALVPGAPTPEAVVERGWASPEALIAGAEVAGVMGIPRPDVAPGIFGNARGTKLSVVAFAEDILFRIDEERALASYLTGDAGGRSFVLISGPSAVHDAFLSAEMLDQVIAGMLAD